MGADEQTLESCGSQLLPEGEPSSDWGVDQLGLYAQHEHRKIIEGERYLTAGYWRLGHALSLARKYLAHGQWKHYLKQLGIEKTRASKACAIYKSFSQADEVKQFSVEEAYAQRKRGKSQAATPSSARGRSTIANFITTTCKKAEDLIDEAAFLEDEEATALIPRLNEAIERLTRLLNYLSRSTAG